MVIVEFIKAALGGITPLYFGGKGDAPPAPDYIGAANAQGAANVETARTQNIMGNPNIYTPYGSQTVTWSNANSAPQFNQSAFDEAMKAWQASGGVTRRREGDSEGGYEWIEVPGAPVGAAPNPQDFMSAGGGVQQPTVRINLSPEQQKLFDLEQQIKGQFGQMALGGMGRVQEAFNKPFSFANADALQQKAEEALLSRVMPQLQRFRSSREGALLQQGHNPGGQAYRTLEESLGQQENDAIKQAVIDALKIRPQLLQEELAIRNIPLNEVNALRTGSQVQVPQFQPYQGAGIAPPPIMQATQNQGQAQLNAYNAQVGSDNALMSGLFGLGGAALGAPWAGKLFGF